MKNKSARHKDVNTFKFQPFSERISNIDVDIFHKVNHEYEALSEEGESYFYQTIQKWNVLNLTEGYDNFKKEIRADNYVTLPQVLLAKEHITEVLLSYLGHKNTLYLQPILESVVAIAQDLQKEFYPYYQKFLEVIIDLLNTKDTEQLEWSFTCLAHLFKILWRPMIKNINEVFTSLLPLLSDSKPEYINAFAAESFAFVARKVKDKTAFLESLVKTVSKKKDGISGCGKLLFEVVKGVDGQFHNCAEQFLPFYFESLWSEHFQGTLFEIVEQIIANIANDIHYLKNKLLWDILIKNVVVLEEKHKKGDTGNDACVLEFILKLVGQMVEYRHGKLLQDPTILIQQLIKLLSLEALSENVIKTVIQISISILLSKSIRLPQEQASQLIRKILSISDKKTLLYFVDNTGSCSLFEALILPAFLLKCGSYDFDRDCIFTLAKLVVKKRPLCISGISLGDWSKYSLDFKHLGADIFERLLIYLNTVDSQLVDVSENHFCALICFPHLELKSDKETVLMEKLHDNLLALLNCIQKETETHKIKRLLFWLNMLLETIIHLGDTTAIQTTFSQLVEELLKHASDVNYLIALKTFNLLFETFKGCEMAINWKMLLRINAVCEGNFNSPYHEMRLLTCHIYSLFEKLPEFQLKHSEDPKVQVEPFRIFTLMYQVESIEPLVHTYRDQLQRLEKLNFDKPQMIMCHKTPFRIIPLRYLCGVLYMNFKLIWEPVCKIIETHAHGWNINEFWSVFGVELQTVVERIKMLPNLKMDLMETDFDILRDVFQDVQKVNDKSDFVNYRILLWKALVMFADVGESKTRDVSQLVLSFIQDEYTNTNAEIAITCNIKTLSEVDKADPANNTCEEDAVDILDKPDISKSAKLAKKTVFQTLINKLLVLSKVKSPKSMYREGELYQLYFELLKHRNHDVQKAALDCLMTYKFKYLVPYKDHLYNLIDEKNFKNEITNFRVDKETSEVEVEHRDNLIPVILQIVFSKMSSKTGLRTGGKSSGQNKRSLILRFLAGCDESEMLSFVQKSFAIYSKYLQDNDLNLMKSVIQHIDLEKCLSPRKLLSTINLLNVILDQFGGLMGDKLLTYLLKILFIVGSIIRGVSDQMDKVHSGYSAILRNIRTSSVKTLERFFEHFYKYMWTPIQIDTVFEIFIWPYLDRLNVEGIHSPTTLLKLIQQWGSNPRYFKLLVKFKADDTNQYILPHVFKLLVNEKSNIAVVNVIYEMVESLLKYEPAEDEAAMPIEIDNVLPIENNILEKCKINQKLNYGSCILLPHVPAILEKIKRKLEGKSKSLNKTELFILCRISELVWESKISASILHLLMPVVAKKCASDEEEVLQFLTTLHNLLKNVDNPENHLRNLTPLFAEISYPSCRKVLIKILEYIGEKSNIKDLTLTSCLISELNAFDIKWLDQPDFEKRHGAFKKIQDLIGANEVDLPFGSLLIYNLFFTMKNEKDLSLKGNSSHTLRILCPALLKRLQKSQKDVDYLLNTCIFTLIKNGMRVKNNADFRNECIGLLGCLARECPDIHFVLRDLNKYTNKVDLEVDFFENLTHLQIHRHARAMAKFCRLVKEETVAPNPKTITQFLLPLATYYLGTEKFSGKNAVIDTSIDMVGVLCRIIPWHQYEGVLKYTLSKLRHKAEFHKQLIRLVVVILDAFHFDLSKGHIDIHTFKRSIDLINENVNEGDKVDEEKGDQEEAVGDNIEVEEEFEDFLENNEDIEEELENSGQEKIMEKISVLCKSTATRVIKSIQTVLLPQLNKSLAQLTHYDASHKLNRKRTGFEQEEEDLARVPISLAVVKLLQRLPKKILDFHLPGVFLKLCTFLKSHLESVRRVAKETFQKIMISLGPKYIGMLLGEIAPLMNRGFQVHVLVFTVHGILNCLKGTYEPKDIDSVLLTVLNLCTADLFGIMSEEKEVVKITVKVSEARSTKSYDTLQILAQYITEACLMDLILPIKQLLDSNQSFKAVQKAQDALRHIAAGLVDNAFISVESLLKFAYGTSAQTITTLLPTKKKKQIQVQEKVEKEDCFIIPKIPGNREAYRDLNVKTSSNTNAHLIVEFGLRLVLAMLKRDMVKSEEYRPFIDPFVSIFKKCLISKHVKLCSLTLQCLQWVMKYDIPSLKKNIKLIAKEIFSILHKYSSAGLTKGDNFDLVVAAFKAMAVLVRDVQYYTVTTDQLKALLMYVEQDMHDSDRQATAFSLLKAIISRKLIVPEIQDVMAKVAELSIISELNYVRSQSRSVFHQFIMEYPLGNTLEKHLSFFISQMSFEMQHGRESAIEMINALINSFPLAVLKNHSGTLLITLGARLVNDEVPECRKMVAECITSMLRKLPKADRDPLFEILTLWLKDKETSHRRLSAQLCGIFVTVETSEFESRLPVIVPLLLKQFGLTSESPGKFVKLNKVKNTPEAIQRLKDHHYFQVLQLILKICTHCPPFLKNKKAIENLAYYSQTLLAYPHDWVRLAAAQFLGFVLSSIEVDKLAMLLLEGKSGAGYLHSDPENCLKSLVLDLCDQLIPGEVKSDLAEQVIKNLVFIARVLQKVPNNSEKKFNLFWLSKRMRKVINSEVIENSTSIILRTEIFKWTAGVITALDSENIKPVLHHLLAPLVREMITTEEKNAPLRQLAKEVANHLKKIIGIDEYSTLLQKLQQNLTIRRAERKRERNQLAVTDPELHAKKKIKAQEKKKLSKKRKLEEIRGKKSFKRRKPVDLDDNSEVM